MSALWSLTYLRANTTIRDVFDTVLNAFHLEIDGKLYTIERQAGAYIDVKIGKAVVEEFNDSVRARMIVDSCYEGYNRGVMVYPEKNGLFTLTDTIIQGTHVYESGRTRRAEIATRVAQGLDNYGASLFLFMNFLSRLSKSFNAQVVHIMFERNPATRATSVHFYDSGQFVDDYYFENMECIEEYGLIELPEKPILVEKILNGRFAFLTEQPKLRWYDEESSREVYFDGEDLSSRWHTPRRDVYNVGASQLYIPFWDEESCPFGAVYCPTQELPAYFLERYED